MVIRPYWIDQIEQLWTMASIVWLAGVRRVGKTSLCKSLDNVEYFNCELPSVQQALHDPENFYRHRGGSRIVLDEIHALENPSQLLKIGADEYPDIKIIATGSSTLGAQKKFRDTLTGRKLNLTLTPMLLEESALFKNTDIMHRFLFGGLPPYFMHSTLPEPFLAEWLASYFARDVSVLYTLDNRDAFIKFITLLLAESGGMFEASRFADACGVSRPTITKYLAIAEQTFTASIIRPYTTRKSIEIKKAPKIYGFDTGFICHAKGWHALRHDDYGILWEHIVLNNLKGRFQNMPIHYWRDKHGHEIDFVVNKGRDKTPITIECKWNSMSYDPTNLIVFRKKYPQGTNFVVSHTISTSYTKSYGDIQVTFLSLDDLMLQLA